MISQDDLVLGFDFEVLRYGGGLTMWLFNDDVDDFVGGNVIGMIRDEEWWILVLVSEDLGGFWVWEFFKLFGYGGFRGFEEEEESV